MLKKCVKCGAKDSNHDITGVVHEGNYYCFNCKNKLGEDIDQESVITVELDTEIGILRRMDSNITTIKNVVIFWFILTVMALIYGVFSYYKFAQFMYMVN